MDFDPARVVVLVGPTGSGKTGVASSIAAEIPVEFICMDSMQLYREMRIGTAAPSKQEIAATPSHLFAERSVRDPMTGALFRQIAAERIAEVQGRGRIPLLVGGTGLYFGFLFGSYGALPHSPPELRERLSKRMQRRGPASLYALLRRLDPKGARLLNPSDRQRIQRFLEVRLDTRRSIVDFWAQQEQGLKAQPVLLGLEIERTLLWERLERRLEAMITDGWLDEVNRLGDAGLAQAVTRTGPIGYRIWFEHLRGNLDFESAKLRVYYATRQYAKRQMTWFRKMDGIRWFPYHRGSGYNVSQMVSYILNSIHDP